MTTEKFTVDGSQLVEKVRLCYLIGGETHPG